MTENISYNKSDFVPARPEKIAQVNATINIIWSVLLAGLCKTFDVNIECKMTNNITESRIIINKNDKGMKII